MAIYSYFQFPLPGQMGAGSAAWCVMLVVAALAQCAKVFVRIVPGILIRVCDRQDAPASGIRIRCMVFRTAFRKSQRSLPAVSGPLKNRRPDRPPFPQLQRAVGMKSLLFRTDRHTVSSCWRQLRCAPTCSCSLPGNTSGTIQSTMTRARSPHSHSQHDDQLA